MAENEKKLNIGERYVAAMLIPKNGNYAMLRVYKDLEMKLLPNADETKEFEIKPSEKEDENGNKINMIVWNDKGKEERPMQFKEKEVDVIVEELKKLNDAKTLEARHMSIYEKFVVEHEKVS